MEEMLMRAIMSGGMGGIRRGGGGDDDDSSPEDAWKRKAGTKAFTMVRKAYKDNNLRPEGRVALLREALKIARDADAPNWGRSLREREEVFGSLEIHIKTCEGILAAKTMQEIQDLVVTGVKQTDLYSEIRTIKSSAKVVRILVGKDCQAWALCKDAIRAKDRAREEEEARNREEEEKISPSLVEDSE